MYLFIGCSLFFLSILRLAATRQSVAEGEADLQIWQLRELLSLPLQALPFACSIFADIATEDHGAPDSRGQRIMRFAWWSPLGFLMEGRSISWTVS